jgi:chromosome segregation ATPase
MDPNHTPQQRLADIEGELDIHRGRLMDLSRDIRESERQLASTQAYLDDLRRYKHETDATMAKLAEERDKLRAAIKKESTP